MNNIVMLWNVVYNNLPTKPQINLVSKTFQFFSLKLRSQGIYQIPKYPEIPIS